MAFAVKVRPKDNLKRRLTLKIFPTREEAEDYPVKLSEWGKVWIERVADKTPDTGQPAPLPWSITVSNTPDLHGSFHVYLTDANGRKIAAVWGRNEEKLATAELILAAVRNYKPQD